MKRLLITAALLLSCAASYASDMANWTERFDLEQKNTWIEHTPSYVALVSNGSMFRGGTGLSFGPGARVNNITISSCGLYLKTESTREQFVEALKCSGVYKGN